MKIEPEKFSRFDLNTCLALGVESNGLVFSAVPEPFCKSSMFTKYRMLTWIKFGLRQFNTTAFGEPLNHSKFYKAGPRCKNTLLSMSRMVSFLKGPGNETPGWPRW